VMAIPLHTLAFASVYTSPKQSLVWGQCHLSCC
jgi:hypothetical protein